MEYFENNMSQLKALVVGASIAGPMAAYWLAKAGARVTVIERFPRLRTNGQAIDIRSTGVTVMRKIPGMEAAVRAKTMPMEGIALFAKMADPTGQSEQLETPNSSRFSPNMRYFAATWHRFYLI